MGARTEPEVLAGPGPGSSVIGWEEQNGHVLPTEVEGPYYRLSQFGTLVRS